MSERHLHRQMVLEVGARPQNLALTDRHQLTVLQRQLGDRRPRLRPEDRVVLAALLVPLARATLRRFRLLVSPDTILRWHPTQAWVAQAVRNLLMDLEEAGDLTKVRFLIRDRDAKYPNMIDEILNSVEVTTVLTGVRVPRMNAIMERWVKTLRAELLDRTLIWNETHLRHALRKYERHYNRHRTHRSLAAATPTRPLPQALELDQIEHLAVHRHDRLGGTIHEYRHVA